MGDDTNEASERLLRAIEECDQIAGALTPDDAARTFDDTTLQVFWQRWPHVSSWAGALWRVLNTDVAEAAIPLEESESRDIGGEGG